MTNPFYNVMDSGAVADGKTYDTQAIQRTIDTCCRAGIGTVVHKDVVISNCHIEGGDDCIALTAFGEPGERTENLLVTNCTLVSRSAGIRVGYGRNDIRNCMFNNITIKSNRGIYACNVNNFTIRDFRLEWGDAMPADMPFIQGCNKLPVQK